MPCILVMALVVVLGFKTGGFKVQSETAVVQEEAVKDGNSKKKKKKTKKEQ